MLFKIILSFKNGCSCLHLYGPLLVPKIQYFTDNLGKIRPKKLFPSLDIQITLNILCKIHFVKELSLSNTKISSEYVHILILTRLKIKKSYHLYQKKPSGLGLGFGLQMTVNFWALAISTLFLNYFSGRDFLSRPTLGQRRTVSKIL